MLKIYICKRLYFSFPPSEYQKMKETRLMKKKLKRKKKFVPIYTPYVDEQKI